MKLVPFVIRRWLPEAFAPLFMATEYGLPLVQVTETLTEALVAPAITDVPGKLPKFSVAALMVQEAVIVIWTVNVPVAVAACAMTAVYKLSRTATPAALVQRSKCLM